MRLIHLPISTTVKLPAEGECAGLAAAAKSLGGRLEVVVQELVTPQIASALGAMVIDIPSIRQELEQRSREDAKAAGALLVAAALRLDVPFDLAHIRSYPADFAAQAVETARHCDLSLVLVRPGIEADGLLAEALTFGSGRPVILVPSAAGNLDIHRIAVAWDGSRVAARAFGDALALFPDAGIEILVVGDEKRIEAAKTSERIVAALGRAGRSARPHLVSRIGTPVGEALQKAALEQECDMLVMGGFGHSRLRDFILGGATASVLADLRLPVLMSH